MNYAVLLTADKLRIEHIEHCERVIDLRILQSVLLSTTYALLICVVNFSCITIVYEHYTFSYKNILCKPAN